MKHKELILIALILFIGCFLRLVNLGQLPNAFTPDEVAQGYTAYSFLQTGKDEWGSNNIFLLKSFGDYKLPLQTWLIMPSIKLFGLNPFAIRFPNALLASLSILFVYLFTKKLTSDKNIALLSSLFIALSPWALPMSRIALEANLTVFLISLASYLFFISKNNIPLQLFSSLIFSLNLISYHSAKLFTPLYVFLLLLYFFIFQKINLKKYLFFILSFTLLTLFLFIKTTNNSRSSDIAIFNPTDKWVSVSNSQYTSSYFGLNPIISRLFNNKLTYTIQQFSNNYLSVFSPQFLVSSGAGETTYGMIPGFGVLSPIPFIGLVYSIFLLTQPKFKYHKTLLFLAFLILISAVPASLAKSNYSANRLSIMLPFIQIFSSIGLVTLLSQYKNKILSYSLAFIFLTTSFTFILTYFFQAQNILANGMLYGHQQANRYISDHPSSQVIYSRKTSEPQAYVMFFQQLDPRLVQSYTKNWQTTMQTEGQSFVDQIGEYFLGKYTFREINLPSDRLLPNTILVARPDEIHPDQADYVIYSPDPVNPTPLFTIYNTSLHSNL